MFERILVPLDGSELAARILVQVRRLLQSGKQVSLLLVVDPAKLSEREVEEGIEDEKALGARVRAAQGDLSRYQEELRASGIEVDGEVLTGRPAAVILSQASISEPSLIAMATHGRGGLGRWIRGSVAERVLRSCPLPLLLVNPSGRGEEGQPFRRILVPLDGSERSEEIVPLVSRFAQVYGSEVVLLRISEVVPIPPGVDFPAWAPPGPHLTSEDVRKSLDRARAGFVKRGLEVRVKVVFEMGVAEEILRVAEREQVDLVALTTHGRTGFGRWLFGSVAEKVLRHCPAPLLVQRIATRDEGAL